MSSYPTCSKEFQKNSKKFKKRNYEQVGKGEEREKKKKKKNRSDEFLHDP